MRRLRWTLVALLVASTVLFAIGVSAERSVAEPAAHTEASGGEVEGSSEGAAHDEGASAAQESERLLGVDLESTPLIVLAVVAGLGLATLAASRFGTMPGVLLAIAGIALAWAGLDVVELIHQLDESRTGIALVALAVAVAHLAAAAIGARLARGAVQPAP